MIIWQCVAKMKVILENLHMKSKARSVKEYLEEVPDDRKEFFYKLRDKILKTFW